MSDFEEVRRMLTFADEAPEIEDQVYFALMALVHTQITQIESNQALIAKINDAQEEITNAIDRLTKAVENLDK